MHVSYVSKAATAVTAVHRSVFHLTRGRHDRPNIVRDLLTTIMIVLLARWIRPRLIGTPSTASALSRPRAFRSARLPSRSARRPAIGVSMRLPRIHSLRSRAAARRCDGPVDGQAFGGRRCRRSAPLDRRQSHRPLQPVVRQFHELRARTHRASGLGVEHGTVVRVLRPAHFRAPGRRDCRHEQRARTAATSAWSAASTPTATRSSSRATTAIASPSRRIPAAASTPM